MIKPEQGMTLSSKKPWRFSASPHLLDLPDVFESDKHIMYAFVESMNERSKNLVHPGRI